MRIGNALGKTSTVVLGLVVLAVLFICGSGVFAFFTMGINMKVGTKIMVNLNDESLALWIDDAKALHSIDSLRTKGIGAKSDLHKNLENKYRKCKIRRIDVSEKGVTYVWMGGFDHTYLRVGFSGDSISSVVAGYNDYTRQMLYPDIGDVHFDLKSSKKRKFNGNTKLTGRLSFEYGRPERERR